MGIIYNLCKFKKNICALRYYIVSENNLTRHTLTDGSFFKSRTDGKDRRPRILGNP